MLLFIFNDIKHLSFSECTKVTPVEDIVERADPQLAKDGHLYQEKNFALEGKIVGIISVE